MSDAWQNWPPSDHDLDELSIPTDDINGVDDCTEVYGEPIDDASIFAHLDEFNDCIDPGGHVWLAENGDVRCVHCGVPAMPMKASREAE
jgi:hypothetical protein